METQRRRRLRVLAGIWTVNHGELLQMASGPTPLYPGVIYVRVGGTPSPTAHRKCNNNNGLMIMFVISSPPASHQAGLRFMKCRRSGSRGLGSSTRAPGFVNTPFNLACLGFIKNEFMWHSDHLLESCCSHSMPPPFFWINNSTTLALALASLAIA